MNKNEQAVETYSQGFNCAQAVLSTYCESLGLDRELACRLATGFGGGMRIGHTCGAVTGAIMILGLKYGNDRAEDLTAKQNAYQKVLEFTEVFKLQNESTLCKDLLGCDISDPDQYKTVQQQGLFKSRCPQLVKSAAEILEKILAKD